MLQQSNISGEDFLLEWNLRFRYDRKWRKKYNIPFGSEQHLEANQIDIYLDLLEDRLFLKMEQKYLEERKNKEEVNLTGSFLKEKVTSKEDEDTMFEQLRKSLR